MTVKGTIYQLLARLSNMAGFNLGISPKTAGVPAPYSAYFQDGLMTLHNNEFLLDEKFIEAYERGIKAANGIDYKWHWRVYVGLWVAQTCSRLEGDYVECGVGNGFLSSAILEYLNWNKLSRNFYLFDTFEGLDEKYVTPDELKRIGSVQSHNKKMRKEAYNKNYESVVKNFHEWDRVHLIKGVIPETLYTVSINKVVYLHIDMNCVIPEIAAIEHFYPKMSIGSIVLLDDYAYSGCSDQKKAMDKWADKTGVSILSLPTGQGMLIKED
jgi:hypothetical protein